MHVAQDPLFCFSYAFVRLRALPSLPVQHASMCNFLAAEMRQHIAELSALLTLAMLLMVTLRQSLQCCAEQAEHQRLVVGPVAV